MSNTHLLPNTAAEQQAIHGDLLAPAILATTLAVPVPGSMVLPAFSAYGYVKNGSPTRLCYVNQPAAAVTLAGSNGLYWLALHHDTHTDVAGWTRQAGTHYAWQAAATQPADPPGGLVIAGLTVAGGAITAVDTTLNSPSTKVAFGGPTGPLAFDKHLTWNGSTLTVRNVVDARHFFVGDHAGENAIAFYSTLQAAGGTNRWFMHGAGTAPSYLGGTLHVAGLVGLGGAPVAGYSLTAYDQTQLAGNVTVGMVGTPASATLDVNGTMRSRGTLTVDGGVTVASNITTPSSVVAANVYASASMQTLGWLSAQGAIDTRFAFRCYSTAYFDGVVDIGSEAGHKLNVGGDAYVSGLLGVGIAPNAGWSLITGGGIYSTGALSCNGHVQGYTTATFTGTLRTGGNFVASLEAGFGREAAAGWSIATGGGMYCGGSLQVNSTLTTYGHVHLNSTLAVVGSAQFSAIVGIGTAAVAGYWLRSGQAWIDGLSVGGGASGWTFQVYGTAHITSTFNVAGRVDMAGDARVYGSLAVGWVEPGYEGYGFHCAPDAKFRANIKVDGTGYKPGGGVWADSNSSVRYKTNIAPLTGGLTALLALHERQWDWSPDYPELEAALPGPRVGFVIEDVQEDRPQWVVSGLPGDAPFALQISGFEGLVVSALREIAQRLAVLEERE